MSHTPGPWRIVPPPTADNGNPWRVAGGDHTVAIVPNWPREADARLIAAAPDLLAALTELMHAEHPPHQGPLQYDSVREDAWDHARAAIAKVEGSDQ